MPNPVTYASSKTLAEGFMDVTVLMANATQLKAMVAIAPESRNKYFTPVLVFIGLSLFIQIIVGILLVLLGFHEFRNDESKIKTNNATTILIFIMTVFNVIILSLGSELFADFTDVL